MNGSVYALIVRPWSWLTFVCFLFLHTRRGIPAQPLFTSFCRHEYKGHWCVVLEKGSVYGHAHTHTQTHTHTQSCVFFEDFCEIDLSCWCTEQHFFLTFNITSKMPDPSVVVIFSTWFPIKYLHTSELFYAGSIFLYQCLYDSRWIKFSLK